MSDNRAASLQAEWEKRWKMRGISKKTHETVAVKPGPTSQEEKQKQLAARQQFDQQYTNQHTHVVIQRQTDDKHTTNTDDRNSPQP